MGRVPAIGWIDYSGVRIHLFLGPQFLDDGQITSFSSIQEGVVGLGQEWIQSF
jgi:hypothetical protein